MDHLYWGEQAAEIWSSCLSCSAKDRCEVFRRLAFLVDTLGALAAPSVRSRARQRLFEAMQAVHLRGETHITMRNYGLPWSTFCWRPLLRRLSRGVGDRRASLLGPRVFGGFGGPAGEVLGELVRFDPALGQAHPQIDRHLLCTPAADSVNVAPHYPSSLWNPPGRRAFFEWTPET